MVVTPSAAVAFQGWGDREGEPASVHPTSLGFGATTCCYLRDARGGGNASVHLSVLRVLCVESALARMLRTRAGDETARAYGEPSRASPVVQMHRGRGRFDTTQNTTHSRREARLMLRPRSALLALLTLCLLAAPAWAAGLLVPRDGSPPIEVESQRVSATLIDGLARTTVRQTFVNPHGRALEALYVFPVPNGATLVDVAMEVGGQRLEGLVVERQKARQVYDSIVRRKRDPALVEQIGRNKFRLSVFPVLPSEPTVVELTWIEHVPLAAGTYRYVYPLALAESGTSTRRDLTFGLTVQSSASVVSATSPTADMDVVRRGSHDVLATLERSRARLDSDLVVEVGIAVGEPSLDVRTFRDSKGNGYFAAVVTPPSATTKQRIPRDILLMIDTSGSMRGIKMDQALVAARDVVERAHDVDRLNVVPFSSSVQPFAEAPVPLTAENRKRLHSFIGTLGAAGATALGDAVAFAAEMPAAAGRVRTVVLLTDGQPTIGETDPTKIVESARRSGEAGTRIFTFGVGQDVDSALLEGIGKAARGTAEVFRPGGEIASRISRFLHRTSVPVMADLLITGDGAQLLEVLPRPLPDVHLGEQAVITGRFRGEGSAHIVVSGRLADRGFNLKQKVELPAQPAGSVAVRDLWARRKIDYLESALRLRSGLADDAYYAALDAGSYATTDEIVQEIVNVSIDCAVQSAYASFLVLLPEDKALLDPRDLASLQAARTRAAERRRALTPRRPGATASGEPSVEEAKPVEELEKALADPVIKDAKVSDHNETDDDMDDSLDDTSSLGDPRFNTDAPFEGPGTNGTIGIGGGAGGAFGGRSGGRRNLRAGGGGRKTQSAVDHGLEWLKSQLAPLEDPARSPPAVDAVAMALLNFLGGGETHNSGQYKDVVKSGLRHLKAMQAEDGWIGPREGAARQAHAPAALAMAEAYGLTGSRLFKDAAQRAVDATVRARPAELWKNARTRSDVEAAAWMALTLRSAKEATLDVDPAVAARCGAAARATLSARTDATPAHTTAHALMILLFCDANVTAHAELVKQAAEALLRSPPDWNDGRLDTAFLQAATLAMFQVGGEHWNRWRRPLENALARAPWDANPELKTRAPYPISAESLRHGAVQDFALLNLCMEVYYRYGRVFGSGLSNTK